MTKVEREVVFNSENGQKEMTGVRHSDDDVKKKVIDCVFKLGQLNNIPEKYVEKNSDCSRSSVGRVYRCNFDGRSPIPNWMSSCFSIQRKESWRSAPAGNPMPTVFSGDPTQRNRYTAKH